jgi:TubC N-terminal docking domain
MTPVDVLKAAAHLGLTLRINGDKLRVEPAERLSPDFAEVLRAHKPELLALLKLPFVMLFSESLGKTIFFCADDDTKAALCEGGEPFSIYTRDDLRVLVEQNRVAPISIAELRKVHEIKRTFNARITPNDFKAASI